MLFYTKKRESRVSYGLSFFPAIERSSLALFFLGFFQVFFVLGKFFFKAVSASLVNSLEECFGTYIHHIVIHNKFNFIGFYIQETFNCCSATFLIVVVSNTASSNIPIFT